MIFKGNLGKKANFTFYQILGVGVGFLFLFLFLSVRLYSKLFLVWEYFMGKIDSVCGCAENLMLAGHPIIFTSLILSGLVAAVFFCFAAVKIIKIKWLTDKFVKNNLKSRKLKISRRLKKISAEIGIENQIIELRNKKPIIFCFGLIMPKICVSSGFVKKLSNKELKAVLLHEQHHLSGNEPIKIFIVKSITGVLFFLPGLQSFLSQYLTFSELAADQWSTDNFKNKAPLAGALYKVIRFKKQMILKNELALSFFASQITEERVNKLADGNYKIKFKIFNPKLSAGIILLIFSFIILNKMAFSGGLAAAKHDIADCSGINPSFSQQQCKILLKE